MTEQSMTQCHNCHIMAADLRTKPISLSHITQVFDLSATLTT